jgi:hypothetical protein
MPATVTSASVRSSPTPAPPTRIPPAPTSPPPGATLTVTQATAAADAHETIIPDDHGLVQGRALGDLTVTFRIDPHVFRPTTVDILVMDAQGQPATNIERVGVTLAMEGMNHGAMGIEAAPVSPGLYRAQGMLMVMSGRWYMGLRVVRTDGVVESGVFAFIGSEEEPGDSAPGAFYRRPEGAVQIEDIAVYPGSIEPREIRVRAQRPVRLEFMYVDNPFCGLTVPMPALGLARPVSPEGLAELEFIPAQNGTLDIECKPAGVELRQRRGSE